MARHSAGETPEIRLKALLKAASDSTVVFDMPALIITARKG
jgi:hypothetical protein